MCLPLCLLWLEQGCPPPFLLQLPQHLLRFLPAVPGTAADEAPHLPRLLTSFSVFPVLMLRYLSPTLTSWKMARGGRSEATHPVTKDGAALGSCIGLLSEGRREGRGDLNRPSAEGRNEAPRKGSSNGMEVLAEVGIRGGGTWPRQLWRPG